MKVNIPILVNTEPRPQPQKLGSTFYIITVSKMLFFYTSNCLLKPVIFWPSEGLLSLPMTILILAADISVSPHVSSSSRALWMNTYWTCMHRDIETHLFKDMDQAK